MSNTNGTITLIPPPDGYVVDFENPQLNYVKESYIVAAVEMTLCLLFLIQRLYTRIVIMKSFQLEDALVIAAWVFCTATQVDLFIGLAGGAIGVHAWEMSIDKYAFYSRVILAAPLLYMPGTAAAKISLALFYRRLNPNKIFQAFVWGTLIVSTAGYIACWLGLLFACKPIAAGWDPLLLPDAVCINIGGIYLSQATVGIVTDVFLIAIPIPTLVKLQMNTRKKLGLALIFCVGSLTIITSIVRLIVLIPSLISVDQPWVVGEGVLWIIIEANLLIMCCCLATLRRFIRHFAPRLIGEDSSTGKNSKPSKFRNQDLRTFGSGGTAKRTLDTLMQTNNGENGIALSSMDGLDKTGGQTTTTQLKSKIKDSDSEEAILFERSVQVTYEDTDGLHNGDDREAGLRGYGIESAVSHQPRGWTGRKRPSVHGM